MVRLQWRAPRPFMPALSSLKSAVPCECAGHSVLCVCWCVCGAQRSNDFVGLSDSQTQSWISVVQRERQRRRRLEEAVETIARQHNVLEASVISKSAAVSTDTAEHDETDGGLSTFSLHATLDGSGAHRPNTSNSSDDDQSEDIFVDCVDNISTGNSRDGSVSATNFSSADASTNLEAEEDTPQDWPLVVRSK